MSTPIENIENIVLFLLCLLSWYFSCLGFKVTAGKSVFWFYSGAHYLTPQTNNCTYV